MKKLGLFAGVTLVMLIALVVYSVTILGQYQDLEEGLLKDYTAAAASLQQLDTRFPDPGAKTLDANRLVPWLEARTAIAELLAERFKDPMKISDIQVRRTRNLALAKLAELLDQRSMGLGEYCAISARWRAILARPEFKDAQAKWRAIVRTQTALEGMPLPDPAADAKPEEVALIRKNLPQLIATMDADVLSILLDRIADGELPQSPPE